MKNLSFSQLESELSTLPPTWIPGLLRTLVQRAVQVCTFKEGGLEYFVSNTLNDLKSRRE